MKLVLCLLLCLAFSGISMKLSSAIKNSRFTELNSMNALAEMLVEADPTKVQEVITLLEKLKNDSITTENNLINVLNESQQDTAIAYSSFKTAVVDMENAETALEATVEYSTHEQAVITENEKETAHSQAQLVESQAQQNLDHQKPLLDSDQQTIDEIISLVQSLNLTSAPTTSPTTSPTFPTSPPTSSPTASVPVDILIMKLKAISSQFSYDSSYWTNPESTLNPQSTSPDNNDDIDAKLATFNTVSFRKLKLCYGTLANCYIYDLGQTFSSAANLFGSGYIRSNNLGGGSLSAKQAKRAFTDVFLPLSDPAYQTFWDGGSGENCEAQLPGINTLCQDGVRARIGYCTNLPNQVCQAGDTNDSDSATGFGLNTQSSGPLNSPFGWYTLEKSITSRRKQGWLFAV